MNTFIHACQWITTDGPIVRTTSYHDTQELADAAAGAIAGPHVVVVFVQPVDGVAA